MRMFVIVFLVFLLASCSQRVFTFQSPESSGDTLTINAADYTLYLRQLCDPDQATNYVDCPPGYDSAVYNKIELEYLFISRTGDRAIYVSNFSDKYEFIYGLAGFYFGDTVRVNTRYLSKIYIGTIDRAQRQIRFRDSDREARIYHYEEPEPGMIRYRYVVDVQKKRTDTLFMTALAPPPAFRVQKTFYWLFNKYLEPGETEERPVRIKDDRMIIVKDKGIYFEFAAPWGPVRETWIRFRSNRVGAKSYR